MVKRFNTYIFLLLITLLSSACTNDVNIEEHKSSQEPAHNPSFGDTETIGDLEYTFIGLLAESTVGSGDHTTIGEKGLYSVLITIKNTGNQPVLVEPSFFTLISGSKSFPVAETATLYKNEYEEEDETGIPYKIREIYANGVPKGTPLTTLKPGEEISGYLLFDVDSDTFVVEKGPLIIIEELEIKSNKSDTDTIFFYFS